MKTTNNSPIIAAKSLLSSISRRQRTGNIYLIIKKPKNRANEYKNSIAGDLPYQLSKHVAHILFSQFQNN